MPLKDRVGEVWTASGGDRSPVLIVRSYLPDERYVDPNRLRHDCVELEHGWRYAVEELVLRHPSWRRIV